MAISEFSIGQTNNAIITGLIPRTAYTVHVRADHLNLLTGGQLLLGMMRATVTATTAVPEGKDFVQSLYSVLPMAYLFPLQMLASY